MLHRILLWVYCLPLEMAVLVALTATGMFFWLRRRFGTKRWWNPTILLLFVCWAVVMARTTIFGREAGAYAPSLIPFQTYITVFSGGEPELIRSSFMNVLLYYPGGLLILSLKPQWKLLYLLLVFAAMSIAVEICQYALHMGVSETDDVIHNTLGALLGMLALRQYERLNTGDTP